MALVVCLAAMTAAAPAQAAQLAGINAHLLWLEVDATDLDRQLDWIQESGASVARVDVGWASLQETGPNTYTSWYVSRLDRLAAAARDHDVKLIMSFGYAPCWASSAPADLKQDCAGEWWKRGVQYYAPSDNAAYGRALAYLVSRYNDVVEAWEVWNEPNLRSFFKAGDAAAAYAQLVRAAYPAAKAANPNAKILAGALQESDVTFVNALFANGIGGHFDGFSVHPYSGDLSPLDPLLNYPRSSFITGLQQLRQALLAHGEDRPIWLTEFGWSTCDIRDGEHWENGVSEATQAEYLRRAFETARGWDWVAAVVPYELRDTGTDPNKTWDRAGLRRYDGSAKPAWAVFKEQALAMKGGVSTPTAPTGTESGATSGDPTGSPDSTGGTTPTTTKKKGGSKKPTARIALRVARKGKRLMIRGRGPRERRIRLTIRTRSGARDARASRVRRSIVVRSNARGRFRLVMRVRTRVAVSARLAG